MKRRTFLSTLAVGSAAFGVRALSNSTGATFMVAHGAWSAGWAWKKMHPLLTAAGHRLFTPTYTGLGERSHLADPSNSLEAHINDVLGVLTYEDLRDVILVGHSSGGMVATGVADRAADRLSKLVYLDAFVPRDGSRSGAARKRSRPSKRRSTCVIAKQNCRAITFTANARHQAMSSASLRTARVARVGVTSKWTRATHPSSRRRKHSA
jgi:pimeloyl-ACP methyl ester carboxylesterase